MSRIRTRLASILGQTREPADPEKITGVLERGLARAMGNRMGRSGDQIAAATRTPEEDAKLARKQRLAEVTAALTPAPPQAPPPAAPLLSTADMLRDLIGQQPPTPVAPLNGDQILTEAAGEVSAAGVAQDTATAAIRKLLGRSR